MDISFMFTSIYIPVLCTLFSIDKVRERLLNRFAGAYAVVLYKSVCLLGHFRLQDVLQSYDRKLRHYWSVLIGVKQTDTIKDDCIVKIIRSNNLIGWLWKGCMEIFLNVLLNLLIVFSRFPWLINRCKKWPKIGAVIAQEPAIGTSALRSKIFISNPWSTTDINIHPHSVVTFNKRITNNQSTHF